MVERLEAVKDSKLVIRSEVLHGETHRTIFGSGFTRGLRYVYGLEEATAARPAS